MLERSGEFEVVGQARDGEEAVRAAAELSPDVIVMDVMMPRKDGVEACREIMETAPDTRVIMLTASTEEDAVIETVAAGATGYLQKVSGNGPAPGHGEGRGRGRDARAARGGEAGLRQDTSRGECGGGGRTDAEGEGDTCFVLPGHVIRRDCGGQGGQAGHHQERRLRHIQVKLGVGTKQEIVVWAVRNGLLDDRRTPE